MATCQAVRSNGRPCGAPALRGGSLCFWHSPEARETRALARKLGGLRRRRGREAVSVELRTPGDVVALLAAELAALLSRVEAGEGRARAVGALCSVALKALEQGDFEERISALEEQACLKKRG